MFIRVKSATPVGVSALPIDVEVDISRGLPGLTIVGLAENAVKEGKERVRSALLNTGFMLKSTRITVNLAPADIKKEGSIFDLPVAVGLIAANGWINDEEIEKYIIVGELSLNGNLRRTRGILPIVTLAKKLGLGVIIPRENAREAAIVRDVAIYPCTNLLEVVEFLSKKIKKEPFSDENVLNIKESYNVDFSDVKGQNFAKRALEVAAAGNHNILMIGPPGSGKTLLAERLPTILPEMEFEETIEATKIYSVANLLRSEKPVVAERPFRSPHHTISDVALIGGGGVPRPGEISLAHQGVLFLDEFPEFKRNVIEALREPMEKGKITVSRARLTVEFPANFMLVCAMNPCPCGFYGSRKRECACSFEQIRRYRSRVSGPILDRIDIQIEVPELEYEDISCGEKGESSKDIRKRVEKARATQRKRLKNEKISTNAQMDVKQIERYCNLDDEGKKIMEKAMERLGLSARGYSKVLKVARTIADLEQEENILPSHLKEALQYRSLDLTRF